MIDVSVKIGNVNVTGPIGEVAKLFGDAAKPKRKYKARKAKAGRPRRKRKYTKKSAYWGKKAAE